MTTQHNSGTKGERKPRAVLAKPLESLVFLLPLIVFSEVASLWLSAPAVLSEPDRVVAFHLLREFCELFGSTGSLMPALAVVVILLSTHVVSGERWRVRGSAVGKMYLESLAWAIPLLLFNRWIHLAAAPESSTWVAEAALGISAGVYEELVFRLVLIPLIVMIGADLIGWPSSAVLVAAVVISALLFAGHHHPPIGGEPFSEGRFFFRTLAGVYLGVVFVVRGYGAAAGAHAAYNVVVLSIA